MSWWNPEVWNGVGVVTVVLFVAAGFVVSLVRGWLVPGKYHREMVDAKDREIAARDRTIGRFETRDDEQRKTIAILANTAAESTASQNSTARVLASIREVVSGSSTGAGGDS
jgi:hypothetical protein